jgi:hypothetical protein
MLKFESHLYLTVRLLKLVQFSLNSFVATDPIELVHTLKKTGLNSWRNRGEKFRLTDLNCSFTGRINFEVNVLASDWQEDRRSDQEDRTEGVLTSWKLQSRDGNSISSAASWLVKILRLLVY